MNPNRKKEILQQARPQLNDAAQCREGLLLECRYGICFVQYRHRQLWRRSQECCRSALLALVDLLLSKDSFPLEPPEYLDTSCVDRERAPRGKNRHAPQDSELYRRTLLRAAP